ncbi:sulfotransferase family 2 domain-containing protein [Roseimicrobium sp. ORNL1]|uniref:sulfotransferase family 2 domain-containing protein n=1 Tax=Roseimicrobium sp. ORNL1 TaxID=2711231 RepID=UPI0013E1E285|nr:sulfotransferase family 2 domain-containing protein [Roseimicrobium sp. ORNL1]QIF02029.1 sulfotransferase family 2 domain-containing protein [Roseimicrobium sp. ORNL1]
MPTSAAARPKFSVIIPLEFHRGQAEKCLQAWCADQTFPQEQFEVVVACPEGFPEQERHRLREQLRAHDHLLVFPQRHDIALCEVAAREAVGEVLFFTESHVYPEADVLEVAEREMRAHPLWAGFSCRSVPITHNLLSQIEADLYDQDIQFGMLTHPWRKVLDQCFVIQRRAYFAAGGFESQYGHFAEWLLAARLYQRGYRIGYVPEARLHHYYIGELPEWIEFTEDFADGHMLYLSQTPAGPELPLFEEVPEWSARQHYRRSAARHMARLLWRELGFEKQAPLPPLPSSSPQADAEADASKSTTKSESTRRRNLFTASLRWYACSLLGAWRIILPAWLGRWRTELALRWHLRRGNRDRAMQAYHACWSHLVALRRGHFLRRWARREELKTSSRKGTPEMWRHQLRFPGLSTAPAGVGFHLGEPAPSLGETLRWSEPAAYVELPLQKAGYRIHLRWLPLEVTPRVRFYLNEEPIPQENLEWRGDGYDIRVKSPSRGLQRLGWVCTSYEAPQDPRALGLAVRSLTWRRDKAEPTPAPASAASAPSLFFLHIRKTAGVSLRDIFINRFPAADAPFFLAHVPENASRSPEVHPLVTGHVHYGYIQQFRQRPAVFTMLRQPFSRALSAYTFFQGHDQAKLDELKAELSAEEYAERVAFLTRARECGTLGEFLQREPALAKAHLSNVQTRQLLDEVVAGDLDESHLAQALRNLGACDVIGLMERVPESIALLEHRLGWEGLGPVLHQNVTRDRLAKEQVDGDGLETLMSWNMLDVRLYRYAEALFNIHLREMHAASGLSHSSVPAPSSFRHLSDASSFTPAQPVHGYGWYPRERAHGAWICWMGVADHAWIDLRPPALRDSHLTCTFPFHISALALDLLQIQVNGIPVEHQRRRAPEPPHEEIFECHVPATLLQLNPDRVRLTFICRDRHRLCDLHAGNLDHRYLSLALGKVELVVARGWKSM